MQPVLLFGYCLSGYWTLFLPLFCSSSDGKSMSKGCCEKQHPSLITLSQLMFSSSLLILISANHSREHCLLLCRAQRIIRIMLCLFCTFIYRIRTRAVGDGPHTPHAWLSLVRSRDDFRQRRRVHIVRVVLVVVMRAESSSVGCCWCVHLIWESPTR